MWKIDIGMDREPKCLIERLNYIIFTAVLTKYKHQSQMLSPSSIQSCVIKETPWLLARIYHLNVWLDGHADMLDFFHGNRKFANQNELAQFLDKQGYCLVRMLHPVQMFWLHLPTLTLVRVREANYSQPHPCIYSIGLLSEFPMIHNTQTNKVTVDVGMILNRGNEVYKLSEGKVIAATFCELPNTPYHRELMNLSHVPIGNAKQIDLACTDSFSVLDLVARRGGKLNKSFRQRTIKRVFYMD